VRTNSFPTAVFINSSVKRYKKCKILFVQEFSFQPDLLNTSGWSKNKNGRKVENQKAELRQFIF
jgi:hypothetical protein